MAEVRKRLSDIFGNGSTLHDIGKTWEESAVAGDFSKPLPAGDYTCTITCGELRRSSSGLPEYTITFKVIEGDHLGRLIWSHHFLTQPAIPYTKRDLAKVGITNLQQLEQPVPPGIRCRVKVVIHRGDDGGEHSNVKGFDVIGRDEIKPDPFAPDQPLRDIQL